jgi:hypothetical protein
MLGPHGGRRRIAHRRVEPMTLGWSRAGGWESFEAWKHWFLQEWGRVDPPPPQRPSVRLLGVYRVFSTPEGVQTEVEVAGVEPAAVAAAEREVRRRARAYLAKLQRHLPDPDHYGQPAVVLQVSFQAGPNRWPILGCGEVAAPPLAPRRSVDELVAAALQDLGG